MAYLKMYGGRIVVRPIQITVTLYSAASDTVTFTDDNGSHSVQTNSSGVASNVSIKYTPQTGSAGLVFTSSVAKDPTNLSNAYSKAVPITGDTTDIYVMPDGEVLYWWGYRNNLEVISTQNGWSTDPNSSAGNQWGIGDAPIFNTNNIQTTASADEFKIMGVGNPIAYSRYENKTLNLIFQGQGFNYSLGLDATATKVIDKAHDQGYASSTMTKHTIVSNKYNYAYGYRGRNAYIYALYISE